MPEFLRGLCETGLLEPLDAALARAVARIDPEADPAVLLAAALASRARGEGHLCLRLSDWAGRSLSLPGGESLSLPPLPDWQRRLDASPAVGGGRPVPLVREGERLYLRRYWRQERELASALLELAGESGHPDVPLLRRQLVVLFGPPGGTDWQRVAAAVATSRRLCIISGGPGTGKTTTLARILVLLLRLGLCRRVRLAAPTGKAAARMQEALRQAAGELPQGTEREALLALEGQTLHRLLGLRPDGGSRHHGGNPLAADLVVVDEASMVDLPLMSRLLQALPRPCRLILLGDRDQLASVEPGAVLADLCAAGEGFTTSFRAFLESACGTPVPAVEGRGALADCVVQLSRSYRFAPDSGIGRLARALLQGDTAAVEALLRAGEGELSWREVSGPAERERLLRRWLEGPLSDYYGAVASGEPAPVLHALLRRVCLLCALRSGPWGVEAVNRRLLELLAAEGRVDPQRQWYPGRPVMVTRNDPALGLYNGDIGIALPAGRGFRVHFERGPQGGLSVPAARLQWYETVHAMTVHKAQGSEYDRIALLLPPEPNPVVTRELLYTAVTRARRQVEIWGGRETVLRAALTPTARSGGLRRRLRGRG